MIIVLMGYMGSGKSTIGHLLSKNGAYAFIDFDQFIEKKQHMTIPELFDNKGEIYFRKLERQYLKEILDKKNDLIVSLGGGTPCYGDNMELIKKANVKSVYLNVPVKELAARLWSERMHRPLLKHQDTPEKLEEFVRKHLFERSFYYNQATIKIAVQQKSAQDVAQELAALLF